MPPRVRRFLLLLSGLAVYAAFTVLTPMRVWAGTMLVVSLVVFVWLCWHLAKEPFPWSKKRPPL